MERKCPICGENHKNIIEKIKLNIPKEYRLSSEYNVVSCKKCGFCFADTESNAKDYDYYYKNCNFYYDTEEHDKNTDERNEFIIQLVDKYIFKNSDILNIGIGNCNFEIALKKFGFENIHGIDPDEKSVNRLNQYGLNAQKLSIYDSIPKGLIGKFEAVFLLNTLEHLIDVEKALINIEKYVKEKGFVIISVPDMGTIQNDTTKIPNNFNHEHINYFSRISLMNLFNRFGFKEIEFHSTSIYHGRNNENGLIVIFRKEDNLKAEVKKDIITENAIKLYFDMQYNSPYKDIVDKYIYSQEEIVVWGTGSYVMNLIEKEGLGKCNVSYFIDNNKSRQNILINGKKVYSPKKENLNGKTIFICSMLYSQDIINQIKAMNIECKIINFSD